MSGSFWVDPERLGRSGQGYYDEQTLLNDLHSGAGDIMLRYSESFGNDKEGQDFRQTFNDGMAAYTGGIEGLSGLMEHIGTGLHHNGRMYGDSRDSADELTFNLQSETDVGEPSRPEQPASQEEKEPVPWSPTEAFAFEREGDSPRSDGSGEPGDSQAVLANAEEPQFVRSEKPDVPGEAKFEEGRDSVDPGVPGEARFEEGRDSVDPGVPGGAEFEEARESVDPVAPRGVR
ncbi:hypothetical protein GCM10027271_59290 [Saccharopolyspora gloriosae]|uniref:Uncharacterized protein n=1 Tax=Saccharopolyspora gloriosae TaxID=455344 RepID=A0A840N7Q6_9PSEU|nr:hypothetical protein [Saccharopolyspora gloriosae]MBB5068010.1 hypothetical protein [Saccharopolyspora gloriosae]